MSYTSATIIISILLYLTKRILYSDKKKTTKKLVKPKLCLLYVWYYLNPTLHNYIRLEKEIKKQEIYIYICVYIYNSITSKY